MLQQDFHVVCFASCIVSIVDGVKGNAHARESGSLVCVLGKSTISQAHDLANQASHKTGADPGFWSGGSEEF